MAITLVPDPTYRGKGTAPLMIRADAMRKLFKSGTSVGDVARLYDVPYARAYKAINPPRQPASSSSSTAPKALTSARLGGLTRSQLVKIVTSRGKDPATVKRVQAASDELDKRFPGWYDEL